MAGHEEFRSRIRCMMKDLGFRGVAWQRSEGWLTDKKT